MSTFFEGGNVPDGPQGLGLQPAPSLPPALGPIASRHGIQGAAAGRRGVDVPGRFVGVDIPWRFVDAVIPGRSSRACAVSRGVGMRARPGAPGCHGTGAGLGPAPPGPPPARDALDVPAAARRLPAVAPNGVGSDRGEAIATFVCCKCGDIGQHNGCVSLNPAALARSARTTPRRRRRSYAEHPCAAHTSIHTQLRVRSPRSRAEA